MNRLITIILISTIVFAGKNFAQFKPGKAVLKGHNQIVIVVSSNWSDSTAEMWLFQRKSSIKTWEQIGEKISCDLGTNGLGWGKSLIITKKFDGPVKHEGDDKSPAGVFRLPFAFGFYPKGNVKWIKLPYIQITKSMQCVDDTNSINYNKVVDSSKVKKADWNSSEKMRTIDEYEYGIFIANNWRPAVKGKGSCIFLHISDQPRQSTEGCTAIPRENIIAMLKWLKPEKHPLLIQLTREFYNSLRKKMGLPMLNFSENG
jgi:zinc D-Ala-D-Ala dipeptidase